MKSNTNNNEALIMKTTMLGTGSIYSKSNCASLIIDNNILIDIGPGTINKNEFRKYTNR